MTENKRSVLVIVRTARRSRRSWWMPCGPGQRATGFTLLVPATPGCAGDRHRATRLARGAAIGPSGRRRMREAGLDLSETIVGDPDFARGRRRRPPLRGEIDDVVVLVDPPASARPRAADLVAV